MGYLLNYLTNFSVLVFVRRGIYRFLSFLNPIFPQEKNMVTILCYHSISPDSPGAWKFGVSQKNFESQICTLREAGYQFLALSELEECLKIGKIPRRRSFIITFDDGYRDILSVRKFLKAQRIRPALFVLAEPEQADRREAASHNSFLSREEILLLASDGWEIGCHGATHTDFSKLNTQGEKREIGEAKVHMEHDMGIPIRYFAYPRGWYSDALKGRVKEAGFSLALSMDDGFISESIDHFAIPRVGVDRTHTIKEFPYLFTVTAILFRRAVKNI